MALSLMSAVRLFALSMLAVTGAQAGRPKPGPASMAEHQRQCAGKDGWSDPAPPIRIFANVYDVGTCGITVLLIAGPKGHILIDAATAKAVPSIMANIHRLGFRPGDIKYLLSSHEHVDHVGGLYDMQRLTGATPVASAAARPMLESGKLAADDPQRGIVPEFTGVRVGRIVRDGDVISVGPLRLTAHLTPGHSAGGTSWSWTSCAGKACHGIAYIDSLNAVSADDYRFSAHPAQVARLRATIARVKRMRCDILVTPHPSGSNLYARLAGQAPLSDSKACAAYATAAATRLNQRLASEAAAAKAAGSTRQ